jgi:hypothetical protein
MGRRRRQGNCIPQKKKKKKFNRDLVGNKENEYPVPDSIKQ